MFEQDLREFVRKGMEVAAIEIPGKDAKHVAIAISTWLRKHPDKFPGVRCAKRGETAYLYKE